MNEKEEKRISFFKKLGIENLPMEEQEKIRLNFIELFLERFFLKLGEKLSKEKQEELADLIDQKKDLEEIFDFLEKEVENFSDFLDREVESFEAEISEILNY